MFIVNYSQYVLYGIEQFFVSFFLFIALLLPIKGNHECFAFGQVKEMKSKKGGNYSSCQTS